jgi:hypothetical protein
MFARVNIIFGEQAKVDAGVTHIEGADRGLVEAAAGNRGLTTVVDRSAGVIVATSYWDEPSHDSEASLTHARAGAAEAAGGTLVVERYAVVLGEHRSVPPAGGVVRLAHTQVEPARADDGIAFVRSQVVPAVSSLPGFCSAELLLDHLSGGGVFVTCWDDELSAAAADEIVGELYDAASAQAGMTFPQVETYAVVRDAAASA